MGSPAPACPVPHSVFSLSPKLRFVARPCAPPPCRLGAPLPSPTPLPPTPATRGWQSTEVPKSDSVIEYFKNITVKFRAFTPLHSEYFSVQFSFSNSSTISQIVIDYPRIT
ncbi:hypothetical protein GUJ93_ZPchr0009g270 [Zizania palustris]|uniref:Uncharacterized protein n=1 Tax=Zizania palustris TaxID=103762 RepID=A0A8J5RYS0_ZIZPA|nr:hypothetical protein GUJ93_ZPchr0009g270 [Zizania palustris]